MGRHGDDGGKRRKRQRDLVDEVLCGATAEQVERWVSEGRADVNAREADTGRTALHAAAAQAKDKVVAALLRLGADPTLSDDRGDTMYHHITHKHTHLARRIKTLLLLLAAPTARSGINARNIAGTPALVLAYGLVRVARNAATTSGERRRADEAEALLGHLDPRGVPGGSLPTAADEDAAAWNAKMSEAAHDDVFEMGGRFFSEPDEAADAYDMHDTGGWGPRADVPAGWTAADEESYRQNMVAGMKARKRARERGGDGASGHKDKSATNDADTRPSWERERQRLQDEMRARERADREASQRIIAEERARTEGMRARRAGEAYQARAAAFFGAAAGGGGAAASAGGGAASPAEVAISAVPFPGESVGEIRAVVLRGETDRDAARKLLKAELMRWHPDRWGQKILQRVRECDREEVLERVQATSQMLNSLMGELDK